MLTKDVLSLNSAGVCRKIGEKTIIQISGISSCPVYFLSKGLVKISYITKQGNEIIKYIVKPGNIFGELTLFGQEEDRNEIATALADSELVIVPAATVKKLMATHPEIENMVNHSINKRIKLMEKRMLSHSFKNVKERVMDFLHDFSIEFGNPVNGGLQFRNFLTHEDIAKIATTSRQSVTSALVYFKKQGWIDYDSKNTNVYKFSDLTQS
ncbi:MAG: Crp/Fnr family transcriptional regulator [Bacteroidetes bacterium]|nr:Crp/Fnr family transcriptional regulator [Bacteroidota bacterium]